MAIQETVPDRLGPYRLLDRLGEGGMGVVHRGADAENRAVAIKVLRPQAAGDATGRRRLAREVETMRRIRSPFVADVIDADVTGTAPYIVTRYVPGRTLEEVVKEQGPLHGAPLYRLAAGLAAALAAIHAAGIVHRDLKPGNVMMAGGDPVVIDFGIAHAADTTRLTQTGMFMGTPAYLAPEVIEGLPAEAAADVHSWGATVAFAARGEPPYGTGAFEAVFFRILHGSANLTGVDPALRPLVAAALARGPAERPTAAWLLRQTARLNPAALAAARGAFAASAGAEAANATVRGATRRLPGAPGSPVGGFVPPAGMAAPGQRPPAYQRPRDVADLLPPVRYAPPVANGPPAVPPAGGALAARRPATPQRRRLLALTTLAIAVGVSLILPVAGTVAVLAVIAVLRASDRARRGIAARRSARGPRVSDPLMIVAAAPWALARSVLVTILLAPLLLIAAASVTAAATIAMGRPPLPVAGAYAAGVYMAFNCLGPASRAPRRELNRLLAAVTPTPITTAAATLLLGSFAAAVISLAWLKAPAFWPVPDPNSLIVNLPGASLMHGATVRLHGLRGVIVRHAGHGLAGKLPIP